MNADKYTIKPDGLLYGVWNKSKNWWYAKDLLKYEAIRMLRFLNKKQIEVIAAVNRLAKEGK